MPVFTQLNDFNRYASHLDLVKFGLDQTGKPISGNNSSKHLVQALLSITTIRHSEDQLNDATINILQKSGDVIIVNRKTGHKLNKNHAPHIIVFDPKSFPDHNVVFIEKVSYWKNGDIYVKSS